ncbi:uncharacterized protein [Ptychodera flava]|uniref:uncharacterized protein n=1 Tax=Ptychodera flava TaxID=63121 RepID=UPI00396A317E
MDKRKERRKIMTGKDVQQISSLQSIYMDDKDRRTRHTKVLKKMEQLQIGKVAEHKKKQKEKEQKHRESVERQKKQILEIRKRYGEEQYQRYLKHFVLWGGKDTVYVDRPLRSEFGLPEEDPDKVSLAKATRIKRKEEKLPKIDGENLRDRNAHKFYMVLNPSYGSHVTERVLMGDLTLDEIKDAAKVVNHDRDQMDARGFIVLDEYGGEASETDSNDDEEGYGSGNDDDN